MTRFCHDLLPCLPWLAPLPPLAEPVHRVSINTLSWWLWSAVGFAAAQLLGSVAGPVAGWTVVLVVAGATYRPITFMLGCAPGAFTAQGLVAGAPLLLLLLSGWQVRPCVCCASPSTGYHIVYLRRSGSYFLPFLSLCRPMHTPCYPRGLTSAHACAYAHTRGHTSAHAHTREHTHTHAHSHTHAYACNNASPHPLLSRPRTQPHSVPTPSVAPCSPRSPSPWSPSPTVAWVC